MDANKFSLVKAVFFAENMHPRREGGGAQKSTSSRNFSSEQAKPLLDYLLSPYAHGYWELKGKWRKDSSYAKLVLDELGIADVFAAEGEGKEVDALKKLSEERRDHLLSVTSRVSSVNALFQYIVLNELGRELPKLRDPDEWVKEIDHEKIKKRYKNAYEIFSNHIFHDSYRHTIFVKKIFSIQSGLVVCMEGPSSNGNINYVSNSKASLEKLREFYSDLGIIIDSTLVRVFAPDEALMKPYFSMVSGILPHVINDSFQNSAFSQALDYYEDDDYQHCISTLGLIAEDYMQRIFTSLLREPVPGSLTIGQIFDLIIRRIDAIFSPAKPVLRSADRAFESIKGINAESGILSLQPVLRELVNIIQDDRAFNAKKMEEASKIKSRRTPFPSHINDNINELLKWRNAASHKSRVPLGAHEADRTLYCLVTIVTWWQSQTLNMDWSKSRTEILEILVDAAKATN